MTQAQPERPEWLPALIDALSEQSRLDQVVAIRPGIGARPAAVLILIGDGPEGPEIMFIERAAGMRTHAGQIAFPGGAADTNDHDIADTALREAAEETGVDRGRDRGARRAATRARGGQRIRCHGGDRLVARTQSGGGHGCPRGGVGRHRPRRGTHRSRAIGPASDIRRVTPARRSKWTGI